MVGTIDPVQYIEKQIIVTISPRWAAVGGLTFQTEKNCHSNDRAFGVLGEYLFIALRRMCPKPQKRQVQELPKPRSRQIQELQKTEDSQEDDSGNQRTREHLHLFGQKKSLQMLLKRSVHALVVIVALQGKCNPV
jgi:hypothetical protein